MATSNSTPIYTTLTDVTPAYGPRAPRTRLLGPFEHYLRERVATYPALTGARLLRELRERGLWRRV